MRKLIVALLATLLLGRGASAYSTTYRGPDAGYLVFSVGYVERALEVVFRFRKPGAKEDFWADCRLHYNASPLLRTPLDYQGHESGAVRVYTLEPGEYEIFSWETSTGGVTGPEDYYSRPFSLKFTIRPGETTYIGTYEIVPTFQVGPGGWLNGSPFYFVIADRHERDLPIAQKKEPKLPMPAVVQVPDVSGLSAYLLQPVLGD